MFAVLILGAVLTTTVAVEGMLVLIKLVELLLMLALFKVATAEELSANAGKGCVPVTTRPGAVDGVDAATTTLLLLIAVTCLT